MKTNSNLTKLENFEAYNPTEEALHALSRRRIKPKEGLTGGQKIASWICCIIAAGIMLETLPFKFTGARESVYIFQKMGTDPWMRWIQGFWELFAAICLLTPTMKWASGILTTGAMAAAILSHLTWLGYSIQGDHGLLFCMGIVSLIGGFTVLILHRRSIPFVTPMSSW